MYLDKIFKQCICLIYLIIACKPELDWTHLSTDREGEYLSKTFRRELRNLPSVDVVDTLKSMTKELLAETTRNCYFEQRGHCAKRKRRSSLSRGHDALAKFITDTLHIMDLNQVLIFSSMKQIKGSHALSSSLYSLVSFF